MGEWSDYFEDFPEENPANQWEDVEGDRLRARVAREANYSPEVLAEYAERKKRREAEEVLLVGMRLRERQQIQAELHRSIGALMEAYAWLDVNLGLKIKAHSKDPAEIAAIVKSSTPMKLRLDCLKRLVEQSTTRPTAKRQEKWTTWIQKADAIRLLRNDYAHGRWVNSNPATTELHFAPLGWSEDATSTPTLVAISPVQIDQLSADLWNLTRSMTEVLERAGRLPGPTITTLARLHTAKAIEVLAEVMEDPKAPQAARVAAAQACWIEAGVRVPSRST